MRRSHSQPARILAVLLCLAGRPAIGIAQTQEPGELVTGFVSAWNRHDIGALASLFTEDADFVNVRALWLKGRTEIRRHDETSHATTQKASTLRTLETSLRLLGPDVAVIRFDWELVGAVGRDGQPVDPRRGLMQFVATRQANGWRIIAAQNTNQSAPAN